MSGRTSREKGSEELIVSIALGRRCEDADEDYNDDVDAATAVTITAADDNGRHGVDNNTKWSKHSGNMKVATANVR